MHFRLVSVTPSQVSVTRQACHSLVSVIWQISIQTYALTIRLVLHDIAIISSNNCEFLFNKGILKSKTGDNKELKDNSILITLRVMNIHLID